MKKLKSELLKQIKINFMIIITSMVYTLFKSQFLSSPPEASRCAMVTWTPRNRCLENSWYIFLLSYLAIFKKGNGERGVRVTIFHEILHSEQFEGAEFIDGNSFLWFLTPVNVGTCHLSGHSFGQRTANASIFDEIFVLCTNWRRWIQ